MENIAGLIGGLVYVAIIVGMIAGMWKTFEKAGEPGWAAIVPFYNVYIMLKIAGKPAWWLLLFLVPLVNIVVSIITMIEFAKKFGKDTGFAIGLALLGFIFFPILGFGTAKYLGGSNEISDHLV